VVDARVPLVLCAHQRLLVLLQLAVLEQWLDQLPGWLQWLAEHPLALERRHLADHRPLAGYSTLPAITTVPVVAIGDVHGCAKLILLGSGWSSAARCHYSGGRSD